MRTRTSALFASALLVVLSVTACSTQTTFVEATPDAAAVMPTAAVDLQGLTRDQAGQLLFNLRGIDAGLVADEGKAITRSVKVCTMLKAGDGAGASAYAKDAFEGGNVGELTSPQLVNIVAIIKSTFCDDQP